MTNANEIMETVEQVQEQVVEAASEATGVKKIVLVGTGFVLGVGATVGTILIKKHVKTKKALKQLEAADANVKALEANDDFDDIEDDED